MCSVVCQGIPQSIIFKRESFDAPHFFLVKSSQSLFLILIETSTRMFGPKSGRGSWSSLPVVFEKVRVNDDSKGARRSAGDFLRFLWRRWKAKEDPFPQQILTIFCYHFKGYRMVSGNFLPGTWQICCWKPIYEPHSGKVVPSNLSTPFLCVEA